jgi:hypothetical protein
MKKKLKILKNIFYKDFNLAINLIIGGDLYYYFIYLNFFIIISRNNFMCFYTFLNLHKF